MGRRLTDAELAALFVENGGMTDIEAWAAVRYVRAGRPRPMRRRRQRIPRAA